MREVIDTCSQRISVPMKFVDLVNDQDDDYEEINDSDVLNVSAILRVAARHGIVGPCLAAEVKVPGRIGHFINIQRKKPEQWHFDGTEEWRDTEDAAADASQETWDLKDFQIYCPCEDTHANLNNGVVRMLMGRTQTTGTVLGTKFDPNWAKEPKYEVIREMRLKTEWEADKSQWRFSILHHGEPACYLYYLI